MLFGEVQPGDWLVTGKGELYCLLADVRCPECGTPNSCDLHEYRYIVWWQRTAAMFTEPSDEVSVFSIQEEAREFQSEMWDE